MILLDKEENVRECGDDQVRLLNELIESKTLKRKCDGMGLLPSKDVGEIVNNNGKMTASMYFDIMSQNPKKSIRNLSLDRKYIFQRDNDQNTRRRFPQRLFLKKQN
ncbi:hypothetical protein AVEN_222825-1 [Araneus ventricosus]|uniref:Uncharacterized protein n=1 Tax=Araneus ventricosus TaxID=182803 RepID=A0A4Y2GWA6_ARAVE|nr:hypothetical protein AVEN_222825-1 [Araneus ventricosus]